MEVRSLDIEADLDQVLSLLSVSLSNTGDQDWFKWKHINNPFGPSFGYVAEENNKIVGVRLFLRWNLQYENSVIRALRPVDTATKPEARGKGVFKKLTLHGLSFLNSDNNYLVFNTPNKNKTIFKSQLLPN